MVNEQTTVRDWHQVKLGDVLTFSNGDSSPERFDDMPHPVYGSNGIIGFSNETNTSPNAIVIGRVGSYCGSLHFSDGLCWITDNAIRGYPVDGNDSRFLYYLLHALNLNHWKAGSGQPLLNQTILSSIPALIPPLNEQRAIAHVLGTLDDKIELNRRMNETLEAKARALFKSWFVDFEPVRAKIEGRWNRDKSLPGLPTDLFDLFPNRLVDSELGEIPEGWEVKELRTFGEIITGKTPSTKSPEYYGEDVPFLRIPDMHGNMYAIKTEVMLSVLGAESQSKKTLPPGSVSVSCIATPGLVVLNHRETQTNQQINSIIPYDGSLSTYLYWTCCHLSPDIASGGLGGSVFGNMNKSTFSALLSIHPEPTIVRAFDALVSPIHAAILANEEQTHTLSIHRDVLLPQLVSGSVRANSCQDH